jgi:hypothetical protein
LLVALALAGCGEDTSWTIIVSTSGGLDGSGAVIFVSIDHGTTSGYGDRTGEDLIFRDRESWGAFWRAHRPDVPPPAVDFGRDMVIASFLGSEDGSGEGWCERPAVTITAVEHERGVLTVRVAEASERVVCRGSSNPHHLVRCRRFEGEIEFVHHRPGP